jgi:hypothetical protein
MTSLRLFLLRADGICDNREDDTKWPPKNRDGKQELEIILGNDHISFEVELSRALETQSFCFRD